MDSAHEECSEARDETARHPQTTKKFHTVGQGKNAAVAEEDSRDDAVAHREVGIPKSPNRLADMPDAVVVVVVADRVRHASLEDEPLEDAGKRSDLALS